MIIHPDMGIELADSARLSARVWMPESAKTEPVPAILEYLPYRKSDGTAARDHGMHLHFARAGYACAFGLIGVGAGTVKVYLTTSIPNRNCRTVSTIIELDRGAQPWCNGRMSACRGSVGVGSTVLQIAALAPDAAKSRDQHRHDCRIGITMISITRVVCS